jgi:hypothetical protein
MELEEFKELMRRKLNIPCSYPKDSPEAKIFNADYEAKLNYVYHRVLRNKDVSLEEINATARVFKEGMRFQNRVNNLEKYTESKKRVFGSE